MEVDVDWTVVVMMMCLLMVYWFAVRYMELLRFRAATHALAEITIAAEKMSHIIQVLKK